MSADEEIVVGDEIINHHGTTAKVLGVNGDILYVVWANMEIKKPIVDIWNKKTDFWKKTGYFDEVAGIMRRIKEVEGNV